MKAANKRSNKTSQTRHRRIKSNIFAVSPRRLFIAVLLFTVLGTIVWKLYYLIQSDSSAPKPFNNFIEIKDEGSLAPPNNTKQVNQENVQQTASRQLVFSNPRAEQQEDHIVVDADLAERVSGVCKFRFEQATSVFETTSTSSNATTCGIRVALSRFPHGGTWYVNIQFASRDGLISATQPAYSFYLSK